jgi:hypothetical protein
LFQFLLLALLTDTALSLLHKQVIEVTHLTNQLLPEVITLGAGAEILLKTVGQITVITVTVKARGIRTSARRANSSVFLAIFQLVHGLASVTEALT